MTRHRRTWSTSTKISIPTMSTCTSSTYYLQAFNVHLIPIRRRSRWFCLARIPALPPATPPIPTTPRPAGLGLNPQQPGQPQPQTRRPAQFIDGVPSGSSVHITQLLSQTGRPPPPGPGGRDSPSPPPTPYGRTEVDLAGSMGPVLITFSLDPPTKPPATAPGGVVFTIPVRMQEEEEEG